MRNVCLFWFYGLRNFVDGANRHLSSVRICAILNNIFVFHIPCDSNSQIVGLRFYVVDIVAIVEFSMQRCVLFYLLFS